MRSSRIIEKVSLRFHLANREIEKARFVAGPRPRVIRRFADLVFVLRCCRSINKPPIAPRLEDNPRGFLVAAEELSGWFGSFNQYTKAKDADESHWLKLYGGRALKMDRKTGDQPTIFVRHAAVCITGTIQPEVLKQSLGRKYIANGLASRFLFSMPCTPPKQWTDYDRNPELAVLVDKVFERLYDLEHDIDAHGDPQPICLSMTDDAKAIVKDFVNRHGLEECAMDGDLSAAWSKLEGYAFRLALIIHCVRVAHGDPTLHDSNRIDAASIHAGIQLAEWFGNEDRRIYGMLAESGAECDRRQLIDWISHRGGSVSHRDLTHGLRRFRGKPDDAHAALEDLVKAGFGQYQTNTKGGRPSKHFSLLKGVTVTKTPLYVRATGGFGDGDGIDDDWGEI